MIGSKVGDYEIHEALGSGAMGSVYKAQDMVLKRTVALKFIMSDFHDDPDMVKRFENEAQVLASLHCPHVPTLYTYLLWEGKRVLVMECVNGQNLESMVRMRGPIPADICVPYIQQALVGLQAVHEQKVFHRDLKPSNIMLNEHGVIKVVDFGIAKRTEDDAGLTGTNMTVGTPYYMAPEQIQGKKATAQTDIYSMGVVLYHLLAGRVPFQAESVFDIKAAHVHTIPEPPTVHYPHIPSLVVAAVMKAMEKDPKNRFQSAGEFLEALPRLEPVLRQTPAPSHVNGGAEAVRRQPLGNVAETAKHASAQPGSVPRQPVVAVETVSARPDKLWIGGVAAGVAVAAIGGAAWWMLKGDTRPTPAPAAQVQQAASAKTFPETADEPGVVTPAPKPDRAALTPRPSPERRGGSAEGTVSPKPSPGSERAAGIEPPQVEPVRTLSGSWDGVYTDSSSPQERTVVSLRVQEEPGGVVSGSLHYVKADQTTGNCTLGNSAYYADRKKLKILVHCSDLATAPKYFNTPTWLSVSDPADRTLTGKIDYFPSVTVDIRRNVSP